LHLAAGQAVGEFLEDGRLRRVVLVEVVGPAQAEGARSVGVGEVESGLRVADRAVLRQRQGHRRDHRLALVVLHEAVLVGVQPVVRQQEGRSSAKPWMCDACSRYGVSPVIANSTVTLVAARSSVTRARPSAPEPLEGASSAA
jgi:hypothetical protein